MDELNYIDDDLTDFINQIANSNDSDSPPGSTVSSSDSNSVRQIEPLETKTVLPPCQVCGGNSSGYHYGADTCEACKVFFYRSIQLHESYKCKNERKLCSPNFRFLFACKACRYKRCIEIGMSRSAIKVGRYSKVRHEENMKKRANYQRLKSFIPFLPRHTYSDDLLNQFTVTFSQLLSVKWSPSYKEICGEASNILANGTVSKDIYMDVWQVTGVELDGRKQYMQLSDEISKQNFLAVLPLLRSLPGMIELDEDSFRKNILSHYDQFGWLYFPNERCKLMNNKFVLEFPEGSQLVLDKESYVDFSDQESYEQEVQFLNRYKDIALTFEESVIILLFCLVKPNTKFPHFGPIYKTIALTFTRYLERQYGHKYEKRLSDIVSFLSFASESKLNEIKWINNNKEYIDHIYNNDCFLKLLYHGGTIEEVEQINQALKSMSIDSSMFFEKNNYLEGM